MLSPYSTVVEKLHRDVNKERVTMMKVERAGDVLVDAVSEISIIQSLCSKCESSLNAMASVTIESHGLHLVLYVCLFMKSDIYFFRSNIAVKSGSVDFVVLQRPRSFNIGLYARH